MRSEETRGRPRYGPARHRPYAALPSLNNDARFPSSLQRTPVYSAIREKPTSKTASNRDSSRPDARTRVIVSFPKGNRLVRANHYHRFPSFFPFPFSSFRSFAVRFRFRLTQLVPSPITFRSRWSSSFRRRIDRFDKKTESRNLTFSKSEGTDTIWRFPASDDRSTSALGVSYRSRSRSFFLFRTQPLLDVDLNQAASGNDLSTWERSHRPLTSS